MVLCLRTVSLVPEEAQVRSVVIRARIRRMAAGAKRDLHPRWIRAPPTRKSQGRLIDRLRTISERRKVEMIPFLPK
jgi:hypothetical protein